MVSRDESTAEYLVTHQDRGGIFPALRFHIFILSSCSFPCRFEYLFNFDSMFEIHDDIEVLKRMGMACGLEMGKCSAEDLKVARSLVPKALEPYVIGQLQSLHLHLLPAGFPNCYTANLFPVFDWRILAHVGESRRR